MKKQQMSNIKAENAQISHKNLCICTFLDGKVDN